MFFLFFLFVFFKVNHTTWWIASKKDTEKFSAFNNGKWQTVIPLVESVTLHR